MAELTPKAIILGVFFGFLFGATTSYLALKVGLTVSASIPIAVLAISLFKKFGRSTILENNIVQTIGSSGESIAAGVAFTLPALVFLSTGKPFFNYFQIFTLALIGGILGVLFMIPLRRTLIVKEDGKLPYPEGMACADILIAGERGGSLARAVYSGIAVSMIYKGMMSVLGWWKEIPHYLFSKRSMLPNADLMVEVTPELLGVGYIIGPQVAGIMVAGGVLSACVFTPLLSYVGTFLASPLPPGTKLLSEMSSMEIWSQYIRYIGAGAVTFGGIVTMVKTLPIIVRTVKESCHLFRSDVHEKEKSVDRHNFDLPIRYIVIGSILLVVTMALIPNLPITWFSACLIVIAGFFFVTVASRIVGLIGTSSNPISGMVVATLMATSLLFIASGLVEDVYQPIALCVGAIVAIAAANAGATSQDLKTGFLVGATPIKQQIGIIIGSITAACTVGLTVVLLNEYIGFGEVTELHQHPLPAPQAMLMSTIVKGLFDQSLPWVLVLVGMAIAAVVELCGVNSLAFAVGAYLPLSTTSPIFIGGLIKWWVGKKKNLHIKDDNLESGALFSSGLIAGGALMGIIVAFLLGTMISGKNGTRISVMDTINSHWGEHLGGWGDGLAVICFSLLAFSLFRFALSKKKLK
jgi:putative OPT family oligopeptide transporter